MKKIFICALSAFLFADGLVPSPSDQFEMIRPEYSIRTDENPNARADYELLQVIDPKTGKIPSGIREKELVFSQGHLSRKQFESARSGEALEEAWVSAGPFNVGGRTRAVAIDVSDPSENTIIAGGVSGGIWKTTNGGQTWRRTSDPELRNSVTSIVQDTRTGKEHIWYYGTGELVGNSARGGSAPYRGDGIFKSVDGGESWQQLEATQDSDPSEFGSQFQYTWRIILDKNDLVNDVVLVAAYGGVLRSDDGGETWSVVLGEPLINQPDGTDLNESVAPFYTDVIQSDQGDFYGYLSNQTSVGELYEDAGVYLSEDGETWTNITEGVPFSRFTRGVLETNGTRLYLFVNDEKVIVDKNQREVIDVPMLYSASVNTSGVPSSWVDLSENLPDFEGLGELEVQGGYNMMVRVLPSNPSVVFLGATNLYRSTDGFTSGNNTDWIGGYNPDEDGGSTYPNHHPDQHDLLFFENASSKVLSANDGGLHISNNVLSDNVQWISLNNGFITSQFYTIDIPKTNDSPIITGGLQDNGSILTQDEGTSANWSQVLGGDGGFSASVPLNVHWFFSFQNSQIYRITFGESSSSFARVDPEGGPELTDSEYLFINPYVLDPINANIMYLAGGNAIWKNTNLAQIPDGSQEKTDVNWEQIEESLVPPVSLNQSRLITALEVSRNSKYLYYGTSDSLIYRLNNPSERNPTEVLNITGDVLPRGYVSSIAANPENDDEIFVVFSNYGVPSIFHSIDAGENFVDVSGNLEEFPDGSGNGPSIRWAEIVPLMNGTRFFVGTSVGLYSTDVLDGADTEWVKEGTESIGKSVIKMMDYRALDGRLVVATHGNGVFVSNVNGFKAISPIVPAAPVKFKVTKAFPNPFSEFTEIELEIPETNYVRVDIYDTGGNFIKTLFYNVQFSGRNGVTWDGTNQQGYRVPRGMYFYNVYYGSKVETGRLVFSP